MSATALAAYHAVNDAVTAETCGRVMAEPCKEASHAADRVRRRLPVR